VAKRGRPIGSTTGTGAAQAKPFMLFVNDFNDPKGRVWQVRIGSGPGQRTQIAREVSVLAPCITVFKGRASQQPRGYLAGVGVVTKRGETIVITG
jgi:hypothetical protein